MKVKKIDYKNITKITKVADQCDQDSVYFCFKGQRNDGHNFIKQAIENGARFVVGTEAIELDNYYQVADINAEFIKATQAVYNFTACQLKFIGVTGTDGKTSVTTLVDKILNKLATSSYLGTSGLIINRQEINYTGMTTPFADQLYRDIQAADQSSEYFVMEVSSHALEQERISGLEFDVIGLTNLTSEHLDYHLTMENYYAAKLKIFKHLKAGKKACVNIDDPSFTALKDWDNVISISTQGPADYQVEDIKLSLDQTTFTLMVDGNTYKISTPLLAEFNVYNLVMAIAIVVNLGYPIDVVIAHSQDVFVEGRLQLLKNEGWPNVIFDFAHTADSINKIMSFVDGLKAKQNIWVVTGSAGQRDQQKRPAMGDAASRYSDYLILTEDDPRDELVSDINKALQSGVVNHNCHVIEIEDRKKALEYCMTKAEPNDLVILLGKSGQKKMYYDGFELPYDEEKTIQNILQGVKR